MCGLKLNKYDRVIFTHTRDSDTQLQVVENLNYLIQRFKG